MKRRTAKKRLQLAERHVAETLISCIKSSDSADRILINDEWDYLGFALTYLLMYYLTLYYPQWPHDQRWIDDIEWESLKVSQQREFMGTGKLWWGKRHDVGGEMVQVPFTAELRIHKTDKRLQIAYKLEFESDGVFYQVDNKS